MYRIAKHCERQLFAACTSNGRVLVYSRGQGRLVASLQVAGAQEPLSECFWFDKSSLLLAEKYDVIRYDVEK